MNNSQMRHGFPVCGLVGVFLVLSVPCTSCLAREMNGGGSDFVTFPHLGASDAELGIINVAKAPYNADPTGKTDSTRALQAAIEAGRTRQMTIFVPLGRYVVTDTLNCTQHRDGYFHPVVMVGETNPRQERPAFVLPDNTPSFTDVNSPKYVVHYWEDSSLPPPDTEQRSSSKSPDPRMVLTNVHYNQIFQGINILVGAGNHGAVGIRLRGAQGSNIENCLVDLGQDGLVGVVGASGSGGSHTGLSVIGGKYGLDFRMAQPSPTLTASLLVNQSCSALLYAGLQTLTVVGAQVDCYARRQAPDYLGIIASVPTGKQGNRTSPWLPATGPCAIPDFLPDPQPEGPAISGQISLVDVAIDSVEPGNVAVSSPRSLYMRNVYVRGCNSLVLLHREHLGGPNQTVPNSASFGRWAQIEEAAFTVEPPVTHRKLDNGTILTLQYLSTIWRDGVRATANLTNIHSNAGEPPEGLVTQHVWDESTFPTFQSSQGVNVKQSPYNATGDGKHDDTAAVQRAIDDNEVVVLPKGRYLVTATIKLRANSKLVGVGHTLSIVSSPCGGMHNAGKTGNAPLVETFAGNGSTVLAFLYIAALHPATTYGFLWQTHGDDCICRQVICRTSLIFYGSNPPRDDRRWQSGQGNTTHPLMVITGGGKLYTIGNGGHNREMPSYRHVLVVNSTAGTRFYHLNTEHGRGDANTEIRSSANVDVFGFKSEGNLAVMWLRNATNVSFYGFGGNAAAYPLTYKYPVGYAQYTPSLFRLEQCRNVRMVNLMDFIRASGGNSTFYAGEGVNPHLWSMLLDGTHNVHLPPMDRPVLYYTSP